MRLRRCLLCRDHLGDSKQAVQAGTVVLGDLTIQGNLKGVAVDHRAPPSRARERRDRVLVPISNKSQFAALPEEVVEKLDVIWYGDADRAVLKAIEL